MSQINDEMWAIFRDDAERLLQDFESSLLALEAEPSDRQQIDELFRHLHTLKGSGGLLGLSALSRLAHQAEDLVDQVREGRVEFHGGIVTALLNALDLLRVMVDESAAGPRPEHVELVTPLCTLLSAYSAGGSLEGSSPSKSELITADQITPLPSMRRISPQQALSASEAVGAALDAMNERSFGLPPAAKEDLQRLAFAEQAFAREGLTVAFEDLRATVERGGKTVLLLFWRLVHRQIEDAGKGYMLFEETPTSSAKDDPGAVGAFLLATARELDPLLAAASAKNRRTELPARLRPAVVTLRRLFRAMGYDDLDAEAAAMEASAKSAQPDHDELRLGLCHLVERIVLIHESWREDTGLELPREYDLRPWVERLATPAPTDPSAPGETRPETSSPAASNRPPAARDQTSAQRGRFLRIEFEKVAHLMSLTGEIGMAIGDVFGLPALQGIDTEEVRAKLDRVEGLIRELQDTSASLGLVSLSSLFERMKRLGRDLSVQTSKRMTLSIKGGDTEIDKLLVDALVDPLVHLLRNAADHGIESTEQRRKNGKPEVATIQLAASRQGEHVIITVQDDGRGMDRDAILARAVAKGLIAADVAGELPDADVWPLVFQAGFTTTNAVSSLSGRGVGMDVVRSSIHSLGGQVSVRSVANEGTTVRLQLPLTLAFLDGMVIRVGRTMFVVPVSAVSRVFRVEGEDVVQLSSEGVDLIRVEDKMVPSLSLESFYSHGDSVKRDYVGRLVVVVHTTGGRLAIPIDELVGNEQVTMKPLLGHLGKIRASAGCGLLRNGGVAIALNCERLYELGNTRAA